MKNLKHSVMVGLMGRQSDRFHEYQPHRGLTERLDMVRRVGGVQGIEVSRTADKDPWARALLRPERFHRFDGSGADSRIESEDQAY